MGSIKKSNTLKVLFYWGKTDTCKVCNLESVSVCLHAAFLSQPNVTMIPGQLSGPELASVLLNACSFL